MTLLCPGNHRDRTDVEAASGYQMCRGCMHRVDRMLGDLADLYDACGDALVASGQGGGEKVTHRRDPGLVLSVAAMVARDHIRAELVAWTRITIAERGLVGWPADTVPAMATFLRRNLDWLMTQDYADELARMMAETTAEARRAAYPAKVRRINVGPCPMPDCFGTLTARLREEDDLLPSEIKCDAEAFDDDGAVVVHAWEPSEWMRLGSKIMARVEAVANLRAQLGR